MAGQKHALGLPRGSIRFVLLGGFAGLLTFLYKHASEFEMPDGQRLYTLVALLNRPEAYEGRPDEKRAA